MVPDIMIPAKTLQEVLLGFVFERQLVGNEFVGEDDVVVGLDQSDGEREEPEHLGQKVLELIDSLAVVDKGEASPRAVVDGGVLVGPSEGSVLDPVRDVFDVDLDAVSGLFGLITEPVFLFRRSFGLFDSSFSNQDLMDGGTADSKAVAAVQKESDRIGPALGLLPQEEDFHDQGGLRLPGRGLRAARTGLEAVGPLEVKTLLPVIELTFVDPELLAGPIDSQALGFFEPKKPFTNGGLSDIDGGHTPSSSLVR